MTTEEFQRAVLQELKNIKGDINGLKEDVSTLKGDISTLKEDVGSLKGDVSSLKGDVGSLKGDVSLLKGDVSSLKAGQIELKDQLKDVILQTADLTEFREETNSKLDTIIEENAILKEITGKHEVDIRRMQKRII